MTSTDTSGPVPADIPTLTIGDRAIATVVAYEALRTPGVARLQPRTLHAARDTVTDAAKRAAVRLSRTQQARPSSPSTATVDTASVDVARDDSAGLITVTVRIIATTSPPILDVVNDLQDRIRTRTLAVLDLRVDVVVNVLGIDA